MGSRRTGYIADLSGASLLNFISAAYFCILEYMLVGIMSGSIYESVDDISETSSCIKLRAIANQSVAIKNSVARC